jgi:hypothetical protein
MAEDRLRTKLFDKRDCYNFPIVNFPFLCSNIPAAHTYSIYLAQLIRYYRACALYKDSSFPLITAKKETT